MTVHQATFTLDSEAHAFLMAAGGDDKNAFINHLLKLHAAKLESSLAQFHHSFEELFLRANLQEAADADYGKELAEWNVTLSDGLSE